MLTDERISAAWIERPSTYDDDLELQLRYFARAIEAEVLQDCGAQNAIHAPQDALSRADATQAQEPVAWALFSDNGNIRIWTSAPEEVRRLAEDQGMTLSPLYAAPQPPAPCLICANRDWYGIDALQAKVAEQAAKEFDWAKANAKCTDTIARQADRIAEIEEENIKRLETSCQQHAKIMDQAALIEKCEKALRSAVEWGAPMRDAPKSSRPYWFGDSVTALAAIAAQKVSPPAKAYSCLQCKDTGLLSERETCPYCEGDEPRSES